MPRIEISPSLKNKIEELRSLLELELKKITDIPEALQWLFEHPEVERIFETLRESKTRIFYKLVIIGDAAVGKTELAKKLGISQLSGSLGRTIGANIGSVEVSIPTDDNRDDLSIQIFDLVGDYSFASVQKMFYLGACGTMVLYDVTRKETFESVPFWINQYLMNSHRVTPIMIVGNKIDLKHKAQVDAKEGHDLAEKLASDIGTDVSFVETSALTGDNVQEAFSTLTEKM
ncbi:MAG: Rab family GTPase, partial [Candidatus Hodarchaeota archaeon]